MQIKWQEVEAASRFLRNHFIATPVVQVEHIVRDGVKLNVSVKLENLQLLNSFKVRGADWFTKRTLEDIRGLESRVKSNIPLPELVTPSKGNHAQGVVLAAYKNGLKSIIYMPEGTDPLKMKRVKSLGGHVRIIGRTFDETNNAAYLDANAGTLVMILEALGIENSIKNRKLKNPFKHLMKAAEVVRKEIGYRVFVPPFEHEHVIAGQASVAMEMIYPEKLGIKRDWPHLDVLVTSIGGGGLIKGCGTVVEHHNSHSRNGQIQIIGVQTEVANGIYRSMKNNKLLKSSDMKTTSLAGGIDVKIPSAVMYEGVNEVVDQVVVVCEKQIEQGIGYIAHNPELRKLKLDWRDHVNVDFNVGGTVYSANRSEGAGAAPYAAVVFGDKYRELNWRKIAGGRKELNVGIVISGGNLDDKIFHRIRDGTNRPRDVK